VKAYTNKNSYIYRIGDETINIKENSYFSLSQ